MHPNANNHFLYNMKRTLYILTLLSTGFLLPYRLLAECNKAPGERINSWKKTEFHLMGIMNDTIPVSKPSELATKEKNVVEEVNEKASASLPGDNNKETFIKVVPKSRRQSKPKLINTTIEVKPIRVIKPKIIRKIGPL